MGNIWKRFNRKDNFLRHSKTHKLMTQISMEVSQTANERENASVNVIQPSRAMAGPSTITEPSALSNNGVTSVSSTSAAPSRKRKISSVNQRIKKTCLDTFEVYTFFSNPLTSKDLTVSLHSLKTEITDKTREIASSKKGLKWYLNSCVRFSRKITTEDFETCTSYFRSKCAVTLDQESPDIETSIAKVIALSNEFENRGSGWEFQEVLKNELKTAVHTALAAASYIITLPPKLRRKKTILNIQNKDQQCFYDLTQHKSESFYCNYCLHRFAKKSNLDAHTIDCRKHKEQKLKMPENKWLEFENFNFNIPVPYTIYADFESLIVKINSCAPDPARSCTVPIADHIPCGYAYTVIRPDGNFKKTTCCLSRRKCRRPFLRKSH
ncbi:uncharacterized protein NPIL_443561 [Nephila pilipes]|uniref:C2H2-type domain-containing protein n=1 Tax=Nephila pilipes TaxID=299642 RepID=A0A8X6Q2H1_NEPPI|nr:uncharacterized protein NPIL_159181 [Nephila pilipes]GFU03015.1 uncharacterized protein NPIL_443561 [Nephila pilipes]